MLDQGKMSCMTDVPMETQHNLCLMGKNYPPGQKVKLVAVVVEIRMR